MQMPPYLCPVLLRGIPNSTLMLNKMKNALILHGTEGSSKENWFPWLKSELEKKGYKVWLPDLPGADQPDLNIYNKYLLSENFDFNSETLIVGHSSGAVAILALLQELAEEIAINKAIIVAPFEKDSPGGQWEPNKNLFNYEFDVEKIKKKASQFILLISDNDKYCPVPYVEKLGKQLNGKVVITSGDGHFSTSEGEKYKELPLLIDFI